ncbi:MAG TPA: zf-HC2 domain-containing protein [Terriglobia bacterium]|nr:zf-HC2 domain-containing protein [Terriglobia bacterium]
MTHLELSNLMTEYLDGALDAAQAREVEAHLRECAPCQAMADDVRFALAACRDAAEVEPSPWLLTRIVRATTGEHKPSLKEKLAAWLRPMFRPQIAYSLSMAIFSLSFILYTSNVNLRSMRIQDVNPVHWVYKANSRGHILVARAEKYYYDLRFVYEVQSLLHGLHQQPAAQPGSPQRMRQPGSASSDEFPADETALALATAPQGSRRSQPL